MKGSTIALVVGALVVLWLVMKRTTGGVTISGSATAGNPYGMPGYPQPSYGAGNPYAGPYQQGTSVAQDVAAYAGAASSIINAIGGAYSSFSGGE